MKVTLRRSVAGSEICRTLNGELPTGLEVLEVAEKRPSIAQADSRLETYEATFLDGIWPAEGFRLFERQLLAPLQQKSKRGEIVIPLEHRLTRLEVLDSNRIRFSLNQGRNGNIRVRDLLMHIFDLPAEMVRNARIMKISSQPIEG
jgi:hypothetical protein